MADGSTLGPTNDVYLQFQREHPKEAERVRILVQEGRQRLEGGQLDEARNRFMRALAIFPHIPAALTNLAALAMQQNNLDQAEEYIGQALHHFPNDPAAHAVAARLWLQREVQPYVRFHTRHAVRGVAHLQMQSDLLAEDPSLLERARVIVLSTLALCQADALLAELYGLLPDAPWSENDLTIIGIALFNLGEIDQAAEVWKLANGGEESPSAVYRFLVELVRQQVVYPFQLDYQLHARLPSVDELRSAVEEHSFDQALGGRRSFRLLKTEGEDDANEGEEADADDERGWNEQQLVQALRLALPRHIPSRAVALGLYHIFRGDEEEAELALSILFFERWPHLPQVLRAVQDKPELSPRVRLNAALYTLWLSGAEAVRPVLERFVPEDLSVRDRFILHIVWIQVALSEENVALAQAHEAEAQSLVDPVVKDLDAWVHVLNELSLRIDQMARSEANDIDSDVQVVANQTGPLDLPGGRVDKIIPFLPRQSRKQRKGAEEKSDP